MLNCAGIWFPRAKVTNRSGLRSPVESTGLPKPETSFRRNTKALFSRDAKSSFAALTKSGKEKALRPNGRRMCIYKMSHASPLECALAKNVRGEATRRHLVAAAFRRAPISKRFRMIFLQETKRQLPWNDILAKKQGAGGLRVSL